MPDNDGDSSKKHTAEVTEEGQLSGVRVKASVPNADQEGTTVSGVRRVLQQNPGKVLAILLAVFLGAGYFIRSAFRYENTDDAQLDGHIMPLSSRISGYVLDV